MDMLLYRRSAGLLLVAIVGFGAAGCGSGGGGPERASVAGEITFDGVPVENGFIELTPAEGVQGVSAGAPIVGGRYSIPSDKGPLLGKHEVRIRASRKTGRMVDAGMPGVDATVEETEEYIPAKYNSSTELTIDIQGGKNQRDFALTSE